MIMNQRTPRALVLSAPGHFAEYFHTVALLFAILLTHLAGTVACVADSHTNTITTPGGSFSFSVDGGPPSNPTIDLIAGVTNIFIINTASFHPVIITTAVSTDPSAYYPGASPQNVFDEPITMTTPTAGFPTTLYYVCKLHGFNGQIHITAPPAGSPPANTILEVRVGTNVVMTSTGTNTTWLLVPEFSSNLVTGGWSVVPDFTNSFTNGTNTTTFPRLDPICGPNVFLRIRQQQN